jgi:hypothetical protein
MPNAQGPGLCSTSVDKKDDHVCSMLVHVVCCNLIRVFFLTRGKNIARCCAVFYHTYHTRYVETAKTQSVFEVTLKHSVFAETQRVFSSCSFRKTRSCGNRPTITSNSSDVSLNIKKSSLTLKHQKVKSNP